MGLLLLDISDFNAIAANNEIDFEPNPLESAEIPISGITILW
jgi:hypothetical protein